MEISLRQSHHTPNQSGGWGNAMCQSLNKMDAGVDYTNSLVDTYDIFKLVNSFCTTTEPRQVSCRNFFHRIQEFKMALGKSKRKNHSLAFKMTISTNTRPPP